MALRRMDLGPRRTVDRRLLAGLRLVPGLALLLAACGGDGREVVTVYSPHGREMLQAFERRYEALHPEVDVQTMDMGSQEILDRLRSERANPQADVWWGAPAAQFEDAAADSLLERFLPTWAPALPAEARDDGGTWHGTYVTPEVIAYNSEAVPADQAPQDWEDVLDPKWRGKVLIRDPMASGTMRTIFGMVMNRSIRATGDTAQGFQWLRRLDASTREYVVNPTLLYQKLGRQEGVITLWDMPDIEALQGKYPIAYVFPRSGTPLVVDGIAVVRGGPNSARARELVEWIGATAQVAAAAREFHRLPARNDVPADSLPPRLREARTRIRAEPMDWPLLQQRGPEWMRHWDEHVRGKGGR
jgi:iron(III) transport system substrate-binding protein